MKSINLDAEFTVRVLNPATGLEVTGLTSGTVGGTWKYVIGGQTGHTETTITLSGANWNEVEAGEYRVLVPAATNNALGLGRVVGSGLTSSRIAVPVYEEVVDPAAATALAAAFTSGMTESYPTSGAIATIPQVLYAILAMLSEFSTSGLTLTAKKLDHATTAFTVTYDANIVSGAPTRATR